MFDARQLDAREVTPDLSRRDDLTGWEAIGRQIGVFGYCAVQRVMMRGVGRSIRIFGMRRDLFQSLARFVVAAAVVATAALCVVPLLAVATGAYASLPTGAGAASRLLLLFLPQAVVVALPIAAATAVFFVCRSLPVTRQLCITVGAFTIATALVTAALNVSVAPVTNAKYRKLAFGDAEGRSVNGRRLNAPGGPGDRFQRDHRWTLPESVLVLSALAIAASRIAAPHARR